MKITKTINLIAFKPSGKYYSEYTITADVETFPSGNETLMQTHSVLGAVSAAIELGEIPSGFVYMLDMVKHPAEVPAMLPID
jgi:hypothetical protein